MGRSGWESAALVVSIGVGLAWAANAQAQSTAPPPGSFAPSLSSSTLPRVPELRLSWPIAPLRFSFAASELSGYANGPLQLFRAESLWLQTARFQLLTAGSAERAFELDCRSTCQPIVKHVFDLEARFALPRLLPGATDTHAYLRSSPYHTMQSTGSVRVLSAGLAGAF